MDTLKLFKFATIALIIINAITITLLLRQPPMGPPPPGNMAMTHFDFTEAQQEQFLVLAEAHQDKMQTYNQEQATLLKAYFEQIKSSKSPDLPVFPEALTMVEKGKISSTYLHFLEVRSILTEEQLAEFPQFVDGILDRILIRQIKEHPKRGK